MSGIRLANAPCSWGTLEFKGLSGKQIGYSQMLDELGATGYVGTELGDWGYMPTEPMLLRRALAARGLSLRGAFVPVMLRDAAAHAAGQAKALRTAALLAAAGDASDPPVVVLSDANGSDAVRTRNAGRITQAMGLTDAEWVVAARGVTAIARAVQQETGLKSVFHHHAAGFVETPGEMETFCAKTDATDIGLVFDTGHYAFGAGACEAVLAGMERFRDRIRYVHFKDCHEGVMKQVQSDGCSYFEAVGRGIFCELGQGGVDFPGVLKQLEAMDYKGWVVVEQDVLPGMGRPKESAARNRAYLRSIGL